MGKLLELIKALIAQPHPGYNLRVDLGRPADTTPEAWAVYLDIHQRMPPSEKIRQAMSMTKTGQLLAEAGLRRRFPEADDREIFLRRVRLTLGDDLFRKAYGEELQ